MVKTQHINLFELFLHHFKWKLCTHVTYGPLQWAAVKLAAVSGAAA